MLVDVRRRASSSCCFERRVGCRRSRRSRRAASRLEPLADRRELAFATGEPGRRRRDGRRERVEALAESPTFAVSSSSCFELPPFERSLVDGGDGVLELAELARRPRPASLREPARRAPAIASSRAWSSRRRLAISPSFFAIADAVVATVAARVSTRSLSTSMRATKRASCFESFLSLLEDDSMTRRLFPRRGAPLGYGEPAGILYQAYRSARAPARSLVSGSCDALRRGYRLGAASRARTTRCSSVCGQPSPRASAMRAKRVVRVARRGGRASCRRRRRCARSRPSSARRRARRRRARRRSRRASRRGRRASGPRSRGSDIRR